MVKLQVELASRRYNVKRSGQPRIKNLYWRIAQKDNEGYWLLAYYLTAFHVLDEIRRTDFCRLQKVSVLLFFVSTYLALIFLASIISLTVFP